MHLNVSCFLRREGDKKKSLSIAAHCLADSTTVLSPWLMLHLPPLIANTCPYGKGGRHNDVHKEQTI